MLYRKNTMTLQTLAKAIKRKKPAIIHEGDTPRYVVLDWETYRSWEELREDLEDSLRLADALADPKNQHRAPLSRLKKQRKIS